jgi:cyclic pyranopterin phosphate synthase
MTLALPAIDRRGRTLRDLRISVTDRCNFRCTYCMPRQEFGPEHSFLPRRELLDFDEITRVAAAFVEMGVRKIRLTGGEPLVRAGLAELISRLSRLTVPDTGHRIDLALTTNGSLLSRLAPALAKAGLGRVTVSLDSLDNSVFRSMTDSRFSVDDVLAGIDAATAAGLGPVKINTVVQRGVNDGDALRGALELADHFRGTGHTVRFIEFMDVGSTNGWRRDQVVPAQEIVAALEERFGIEPVDPAYVGEVADRYRYRDGTGEIGFIRSVSAPFCGTCTRARLSADGTLYTCQFAAAGIDLRGPLRSGATDNQLVGLIGQRWRIREDRYSELRRSPTEPARAHPNSGPRIEMSYIGG